MAEKYLYCITNEAPVYQSVANNKGIKVINRILMGTYVSVLEEQGNYTRVSTAGPDGWMKTADLADTMGLKVFFLDVGQGDGVLIEVGKLRILVDSGPGKNMHGYLSKWQYSYLLKDDKPVHIDYVFVSHFDTDHYKGLTSIISDPHFTFGTIFHPGILKYAAGQSAFNSGLGHVSTHNGTKYLTTFTNDLLHPDPAVGFNRDITSFLSAVAKAKSEQRIHSSTRLNAGQIAVNQSIEGKSFEIKALAPWCETISGQPAFAWFGDEGKTINGHSLVLKITFGTRSLLLGGDLNTLSEQFLIQKYGTENPFETDVAKSCHHGSSDFTEAFMQKVNPYATVISSGDNESFAHPRADAIGCAGKYSRGSRPLVYSTELARSYNPATNKILFGMINLRCNGSIICMSQMKESNTPNDLWDSYTL